MVRSDLHHQGEIATCRTTWREKQHPGLGRKKERCRKQWALSEASLGSLMFCMRRYKGKHMAHSTVTCKEMGKGWEKCSTTDTVALQNTHYSYVSAAPLRKGSKMLEAIVWTQRGIQLSSGFLDKKKRLGGPDASKGLQRYPANISLLKLGWTHHLYCTVCYRKQNKLTKKTPQNPQNKANPTKQNKQQIQPNNQQKN